jgi:hypothetical protein
MPAERQPPRGKGEAPGSRLPFLSSDNLNQHVQGVRAIASSLIARCWPRANGSVDE